MTKILFMVFHFPPISGGGVVVIVELANSLAKLGHDVTILTPKLKWDGPVYNPELNSKIKIIKILKSGTPLLESHNAHRVGHKSKKIPMGLFSLRRFMKGKILII